MISTKNRFSIVLTRTILTEYCWRRLCTKLKNYVFRYFDVTHNNWRCYNNQLDCIRLTKGSARRKIQSVWNGCNGAFKSTVSTKDWSSIRWPTWSDRANSSISALWKRWKATRNCWCSFSTISCSSRRPVKPWRRSTSTFSSITNPTCRCACTGR